MRHALARFISTSTTNKHPERQHSCVKYYYSCRYIKAEIKNLQFVFHSYCSFATRLYNLTRGIHNIALLLLNIRKCLVLCKASLKEGSIITNFLCSLTINSQIRRLATTLRPAISLQLQLLHFRWHVVKATISRHVICICMDIYIFYSS